ncbi:hypothetical protein ASZ90_018444 [hydrocarbon metagenome]|uniref:Uncharacterized protein n=1 Tax=hydrocarbon metagenome TaxID=938273 RepID=A0A0W8E6F5_9ZZZZ
MREFREYGKENRFIPAGPFKVRLPGVHYRWEWADYIQGLIMCAVCLGAIPILQETLGMPFEVAIAIVVLNGFLYTWHTLLGDPVVPGWITPAIPLLIAYCLLFPEGAPRMQALIAFEMGLGIFAIFLGITGLAGKLISLIPHCIKSGVIMGAGFSAIYMIFIAGGKFDLFPITCTLCLIVAFYLLFSNHFKSLMAKGGIWSTVGNLGILPCIIVAIIAAPLVGETPWPVIEWSITKPAFGVLWTEWVPWGALGWPTLSMYAASIPTILAVYIVLFGDVVQSQALVKDADITRPDELIEYSPDRAHLIFGMRNLIMSIMGPDITMCGPLWAAMQVVTCERYKKGRDSMDSIFGGAASFRWGTFTGYWLMPIVTLTKPILPVALALTMIVQGFVSVRIGVMESRSFRDLGIAGVIGGVLLAKGAAYAFAVGILATFLAYGNDFFKGDVEFGHLWSDQIEKWLAKEEELIKESDTVKIA